MPKCPLYEEYLTCGTCEGTCAFPKPPCDRSCKPAGCYCKQDYVRSIKGNCVQYFYRMLFIFINSFILFQNFSNFFNLLISGEADATLCKNNEEYVSEKGKGYYENTCDDPPPLPNEKPYVDPNYPLPCGCYCPQPFVRNEIGQCVVYERCGKKP